MTRLAQWIAGARQPALRDLGRELLGCPVEAQLSIVRGRPRPNAQAPTLEILGDALAAVVEIDPALAAWLVDRALGGEACLARLDAGLGLRDETSLGVLAYVAARALSCVASDAYLGDVVADASALIARLADEPASCFAVRVLCQDVERSVHVWAWQLPPHARDTRTPASPRLAPLLLEPRVLRAQLLRRCAVERGLRSLLPGDILPIRDAQLVPAAYGFAGRARLQLADARAACWVADMQAERLTLQELLMTPDEPSQAGTVQRDPSDADALSPVIRDAPIEIAIEIARFTLPLGEIAALCPGQVLLSGRPLGEHVTLRVGATAIGTGELVNVDGTVGVRILSLAGT